MSKDQLFPVCVGNGPIIGNGSKRLINRHTGQFLSRVAEASGPVRVLQYLVSEENLGQTGGLCDFDLSTSKLLVPEGVSYRIGNQLLKQIDRFRAYLRLRKRIRNIPWAYMFLPGRYPAYACKLCMKRRIPFGVYIRGPIDPADESTSEILSQARLIVCNNVKTAREISHLSANVRVAKAMMDVTLEDVVRERQHVEKERTKILFVGRVNNEKGIADLYKAAEILQSRGVAFQLSLAGNGPLAAAEHLPGSIKDHVQFHGFVASKHELETLYKQADIFVLASYFEGFPRVLYEAMTYGCAITTTFVDGIESLMKDDVNCLQIVPGDHVGIANALERLCRDHQLRNRLAAGGTETIIDVHETPTELHESLVINGLSL
jgi:glycosyltransferase involved in cell wall biosynthesis